MLKSSGIVTDEISKRYMELAQDPVKNQNELQEIVRTVAMESGYPVEAYHGTGRADRVGSVFREDRATSGPMAFFTDDEKIASNYARDKKDTSIEYEGQDEFAVFVLETHSGTSVVALFSQEINNKQVVSPVVIDGFGV